jgi:hypothetical protein
MSQAISSIGAGEDRQDFAIEHIKTALHGLRYGSVVVTVQDGIVVQIDRTEKNRLTAALNGRHTPRGRNGREDAG